MTGITKDFPGGRVLSGVDFSLARGEVHALVGQNGAGKSTLMKILGGVYREYGGTIDVDGRRVRIIAPRTAIACGVAVIYQEFTLVPHFTVAENVALGREPGGHGRGTLDHRGLLAQSRDEATSLGIDLPMSVPVTRLGVASQQLTEIVKAVSRRAKILVMDEPTARLSGQERDRLFTIIRDLSRSGVGVVYISHFLEEIFEIADRVTVLRDGHMVGEAPTSELDLTALTHLIVGARYREVEKRRTTSLRPGTVALSLNGFGVPGRVGPVDLEVGQGEIVGLAGLVGSGRTTLARAMVGAVRGATGRVATGTWSGVPKSPTEAAAAGILMLTEDRKREGIIAVRSMTENIAVTALARLLSSHGFVRLQQRRVAVDNMISRLNIVPPDGGVVASRLSGGNQQKVLFARAMAAATPVAILDQPTAGIDVGSKADLYARIDELAHEGVAMILISDDLDELLSLCDRIVVVHRGRVVAPRAAAEFDRQQLLHAITGGVPAAIEATS